MNTVDSFSEYCVITTEGSELVGVDGEIADEESCLGNSFKLEILSMTSLLKLSCWLQLVMHRTAITAVSIAVAFIAVHLPTSL